MSEPKGTPAPDIPASDTPANAPAPTERAPLPPRTWRTLDPAGGKPAPPAKAVQDLMSGLQEIQAILDILDPPGEVVIEDIYGNKYNVRVKNIPARAQIRIGRILADLPASVVAADVRGADRLGILRALMTAATSEPIAEKLAEAFVIAQPEAWKAAFSTAAAYNDQVSSPLDVFGLDALIEGLFPFVVRLAGRLVSRITGAPAAVAPPAIAP